MVQCSLTSTHTEAEVVGRGKRSGSHLRRLLSFGLQKKPCSSTAQHKRRSKLRQAIQCSNSECAKEVQSEENSRESLWGASAEFCCSLSSQRLWQLLENCSLEMPPVSQRCPQSQLHNLLRHNATQHISDGCSPAAVCCCVARCENATSGAAEGRRPPVVIGTENSDALLRPCCESPGAVQIARGQYVAPALGRLAERIESIICRTLLDPKSIAPRQPQASCSESDGAPNSLNCLLPSSIGGTTSCHPQIQAASGF